MSELHVFWKRLKSSHMVENRIESGTEGKQWKENGIQTRCE